MDASREGHEFRRIALVAKVERVETLIATYWEHLESYRRSLNNYYELLGRIGERLGEPEPKEL